MCYVAGCISVYVYIYELQGGFKSPSRSCKLAVYVGDFLNDCMRLVLDLKEVAVVVVKEWINARETDKIIILSDNYHPRHT